VTPRNLVDIYERFAAASYLNCQGKGIPIFKVDAAGPSEPRVRIYHTTTRHHIPEDINRHTHRYAYLSIYRVKIKFFMWY
jgi:hypothetical protein